MTNKMPVVGKRYRATKHRNYIILVSDVNHNYISYIHDLGKDDYSMVHAMLINEFWGEFEELPNSNLQKPEEVQVDLEKKEVNEVERALKELKKSLFSFRLNFDIKYPPLAEIDTAAQNLVDALEAEKSNRCNNTCIAPVVDLSKPEPATDDNEQAYCKAISKYPEGVIAHSFSPYEPCECRSDPKAYTEFMSKPEPKIDMKEERVEPVSIWKDVREKIDNQSIIFVNKAGYARLAEYWNDKVYFIEGDFGDVRAHYIAKNYYGKKYCTLTDFINAFEQMQKDIEELKRKSI